MISWRRGRERMNRMLGFGRQKGKPGGTSLAAGVGSGKRSGKKSKKSSCHKLVCNANSFVMKNRIRQSIELAKNVQRAIREGRAEEFLQTLKEQDRNRKKKLGEFQKLQMAMWRPMLHESMDGAAEFAVATMYLGFALGACTVVLLKPSLWSTWLALLLLVCGGFGPYYVRKAIKEHITWPRTGYVAGLGERKSSPKWRVAGLLYVLGMGIVFTVWQVREMRHQHALGRSPIIQTAITEIPMNHAAFVMRDLLVVSSAMLYLMVSAAKIRKQPWRVLLLALMVSGPLVFNSMASGGFNERMLPLMLFFGLVWLLSGGATLYLYLRDTKPPAPATE
jgi:hypothetical protein